MRNSAWISILGIYNHYPDVFDNLKLPKKSELPVEDWLRTDMEDLDKTICINNILMNLAELPLVYTKPDVLKSMIGIWSNAHAEEWMNIWQTELYKYVPIWNKDGTYTTDRNLTTSGTSSGTLSDTTSGSGTISGTHGETTTVDASTSGTSSGTENRSTVTDQDQTDSYTKITDQDTTGTTSGTESKSTVTDQDTSKTATSSGRTDEDRTVEHKVTGFDTDSYANDTEDVTDGSVVTSGSASETGTNDVTETVSGTTSGSSSGTNDVTETNTGSATNDIEVTETGTTSGTTSGTSESETVVSGTTGQTSTTSGTLSRSTGGTTAGTEDEAITRRETGNIGITTTQQMIREQRELVQFCMYDYICEAFKHQFCLMVY